MKIKIIVKGEKSVGKTTFARALLHGAFQPHVTRFNPTEKLVATEGHKDEDIVSVVELPANQPIDPNDSRQKFLSPAAPVAAIVTVIPADSEDIQSHILYAKSFIDSLAITFQREHPTLVHNFKKPMLLFVLGTNTDELLTDPEEEKMALGRKDRIIENARRVRDEVVAYALKQKLGYDNQAFYAECYTYNVTNQQSNDKVYQRIKLYARHPEQCVQRLQTLEIGSFKDRMQALLKELEEEHKSRFAFNKEDKLVKIKFLRKVLHAYEQFNNEDKTDKQLKVAFEMHIKNESDANRVILEKGLRSRVKTILAEALSQDERYLVELIRYRDELLEEAKPWKPYLNKKLKMKKASFLTDVIETYKKGNQGADERSLNEAYNEVSGRVLREENEKNVAASSVTSPQVPGSAAVEIITFAEVTKGIRSRVKKLLDNIPKVSNQDEVKGNSI